VSNAALTRRSIHSLSALAIFVLFSKTSRLAQRDSARKKPAGGWVF
jgi:hypothetical protein